MPLPQLQLHALRTRQNQLRRVLARVGKILDGRLGIESVHDLGHDHGQPDHLRKQDLALLILLLLLFGLVLSGIIPVTFLLEVLVSNRSHSPIGAEDM
jgi:hypothetical protein